MVTSFRANEIESSTDARGTSVNRKKHFVVICILSMLAVCAGIVFRCSGIEQKLYELDECATSFFIAGYSVPDALNLLGKEVDPSTLQKLQSFDPSKSTAYALHGLSRLQPEQGPLYYVIVRSWARLMSSGIEAVRTVSVIAGILVIPATYFLCLEIASSPLFAVMACALISLSPLQLVYSQQARPYMLWNLLILVSTTLLLRALRTNSNKSWIFYTLSAAATAYAHLATYALFAAHACFGAYLDRFRPTKRLLRLAAALLVAVVLLLPWLRYIIFGHASFTECWHHPLSANNLLSSCALNVVSTFALQADWLAQPLHKILYIGILSIVGAAAWITFSARSKQPAGMCLLFLCMSPLTLLARDVISGDCIVTVDRFIMPALLGVQLMVAFAVAQLPVRFSGKGMLVSTALFATLLSIEAGSCLWLSKQNDYHELGCQMDSCAAVLKDVKHPLVVGDTVRLWLLCHADTNKTMRLIPTNPDDFAPLDSIHEPFYFLPCSDAYVNNLRPERYSYKHSAPELLFVQPTTNRSDEVRASLK